MRIPLLAIPFEQRGGPRVHGQDRSFEADFPPHEKILEISEGGHMPGHHLVAHELLELRYRNLKRGVQFVGSFVFRRAIGFPRAAQVVHGAREPCVLDGEEGHVRAGDIPQRLQQVGREVADGQGIVLRDERGTQGRDGFRRDETGLPLGVHTLEQVTPMPGRGEQLCQQLALGNGIRRFRRLAP